MGSSGEQSSGSVALLISSQYSASPVTPLMPQRQSQTARSMLLPRDWTQCLSRSQTGSSLAESPWTELRLGLRERRISVVPDRREKRKKSHSEDRGCYSNIEETSVSGTGHGDHRDTASRGTGLPSTALAHHSPLLTICVGKMSASGVECREHIGTVICG